MKSVGALSALPDRVQRKQILSFEFTSRGLEGDVDFDFVAGQTFGLTKPDLAQAVKQASLASVSNGTGSTINTSDLLDGVRKVAGSPGRRGSIYDPQEKKKMAFAAAGRAVVAASVGHHGAIEELHIAPAKALPANAGAGPPAGNRAPSEIPEELVVWSAGTAAEKLFFGNPATPSYSTGNEMHEQFARAMEVSLGGPSNELSKAAEQCAIDILSTYRSHVEAIASRLEDEETLAGPLLKSMLESVHREAELFGPPCFAREPTAISNGRPSKGR